jgi:putative addiction module component (TIGR02574 family)
MSTEQLEQRVAALERTVTDLRRQVALRIATEPPSELSEDLKAESDRRLADAAANPGDSVPWEEVRAAALARFEKK